MVQFPDNFLDELKARLKISQVVGKRVALSKRGANHFGLCPFHNEKSPSFSVVDDKGFYHCFGCGAHGDSITFVMETEGLTFHEAVESLAGSVGMQLPAVSPDDIVKNEQRKKLYECLKAANTYFMDALKKPVGDGARNYLNKRKIIQNTIEHFQLGFAPDTREDMILTLRQKGFEDEHMVKTGLIKPRDDGSYYEVFRGRLMFPIHDPQGRIIGFGGRSLDGKEPKYLNSPETDLFHKGRTLYGHHLAKGPAREAERIIVVEGYTDVIGLYQAGFRDAVAPLGTALTADQLQLLWRLADVPLLCLDGDEAGQRAAARAANLALSHIKPGHSLQFLALPAGDDPDSFIQKLGPDAFKAFLKRAEPLADKIFQWEMAAKPVNTPEQRADLRTRLTTQQNKIQDAQIRKFYGDFFQEKLSSTFKSQTSGKYPSKQARSPAQSTGIGLKSPTGLQEILKKGLLAAIINHPELLFDHLEHLGQIPLHQEQLKRLVEDLEDIGAYPTHLTRESLFKQLADKGHQTTLDSIFTKSVYDHCPFAKPGKDLEEAKVFWQEVFDGLVKKSAQNSSQSPEDDELTTAEGWEKFVKARESMLKDQADIDE